jgi:polyhydroxyalkanoate synthesis regulator phasin
MASNERIRKYLDAGTVLGQVSRGRAEEIVRELVNAGDIQRSQAQEWVDNLVERSQKSSEQVLELVRHEVAVQLEKIDPKSLESLANQVAEVLKKTAAAGRNATKDATTRAGQAAKDVTSKTAKTAKDATNKAGQTAKGVTAQAGKAAKDVTTQAGKTATRARDAATKVAPSRLPGIRLPSGSSKAKADTESKAEAKKSHGKKVSEANDSASKKAAS